MMKLIRSNTKNMLLSVALLLPILLYSQDKSLLLGKWKVIENKDKEGEEMPTIIGGSEENIAFKIRLFGDGTGYDYESETNFDYELKNQILSLGNRSYKVIKLSAKKMVLEEVEDEFSLSVNKLTLIKVDD